MTLAATPTCYRFGHFELQPDERRLLTKGAPVHLGPHAFDLLVALVERSGHLVTKDELLARVWPRAVVEENTLQVHVSALRKVLGADAIATVSGRGYRFVSEVVRVGDPSTSDAPVAKHNLPNQLTSFIGREKEIARIRELLGSTRLLTLTGAGGCGKTRLALRVAGEVLETYSDGVWLVELAPLGDPTLIAQTVANALGVKEQAGIDLRETVAEWLESRNLLLVLDNAEHLLGASAELVDFVLRRCGRLEILVTSRERMGIAGELTYRVPSLSVPDSQQGAASEEVLACEAARLFIERARLHRPDMDITTKDAGALTSICRRLDGIALAIELAAPRLRAMSLTELSRRLDDQFAVLTGGSRTALPRHRTLRSLIDWSFDLLSDAEKTLLRRASVFAGGWTVETAGTVCAGEGIDRSELRELLTSLADKSLLVAETHDDVTRFGMLETVRHYAQDRLRDSGEQEAVRARHVDCFVVRACALDEDQGDTDRQLKLSHLDDELDNLRAALAVCETTATCAMHGLRLAAKLYWFWSTRGLLSEGRNWITRLLAVAPSGRGEHDQADDQEDARADDLGSAFMSAGVLAHLQGDFVAAEPYYRQALAIRRRLGPPRKVATLLGNLGAIAMARDDDVTARKLIEEGLAIAREADDRRSIGWALQSLGVLSSEAGDYEGAVALLEESVSVRRAFGRWSMAESLMELGRVRHALGDHPGARNALTEAIEAEREFGNRQGVAKVLIWLAIVSHDEGDVGAAKAQLQESLAILHALGDRAEMAVALEAFAGLMLECAGPIEAARLWGRAQRLHEETGSPQGTPERERSDRQVAAARSVLQDDAAFDRGWDDGRSLTLDAVVRLALEA